MRVRRRARIACTSGTVVLTLAVAVAAAVACSQEGTGAHVYVRLGSLQYDELGCGVTRTVTGNVIVYPSTAGRYFFSQAEDGIRDATVTGVQTCALPMWRRWPSCRAGTEDSGFRRRPRAC